MYVVQPSSVPVDRRIRRAKSDGIDSELLLRTLLAWLRGEPRVCSMVPVSDEADEDARRCVRERSELISERIGRDQGKVPQARELLAPVYGWFTEGFDTRDLKEAKVLLEELHA